MKDLKYNDKIIEKNQEIEQEDEYETIALKVYVPDISENVLHNFKGVKELLRTYVIPPKLDSRELCSGDITTLTLYDSREAERDEIKARKQFWAESKMVIVKGLPRIKTTITNDDGSEITDVLYSSVQLNHGLIEADTDLKDPDYIDINKDNIFRYEDALTSKKIRMKDQRFMNECADLSLPMKLYKLEERVQNFYKN